MVHRAASLNYRDHLVVEGLYDPRLPLPLTPASDGAGEVVEVGSEVTAWRPGDRVCAAFAPTWQGGAPTPERLRTTLGGTLPGTLQQLGTYNQAALVRVPEHLSWEEAATLPCAGVTAWNALRGLPPGSRVVLLGSGGVSTFALQFAAAAGLEPLVVSGSPRKADAQRALGAAHVVARDAAWSKAVRSIWPEGADCVVEVGGAGTLEQSLRCLRPAGRIALIGVLAGHQQPLNLLPIIMNGLQVTGVMVGSRDDFIAMNRFLQARQLRPLLDATYPWQQANEALRHLATGSQQGKVVVSGCA